MLLRRYITKHRAAIPPDHGSSDATGDVVVAGRNIRRQRPERVKWSLAAPFKLLGHIFLDEVHRNMPGAFVHNLDALGPCAAGEFALRLKLAELRLVIRVGDRARTQAIANAEAHIIGGHDVADVVPVRVEEVFLVMGETPFRHNATTTGNDASHARSGERHEAQEHTGVDREIVNALLGLLDESIPEDIPSEIFSLASHLLQSLINRHCANGDW